ncbi:hypothetical protein SAMN05443999_11814 [Roseovarius azorensis]|uniref:Uncharacterized protein n=1 Tax=Roseovarius azorensis TaxID=1287727 RepID=A0A1H7X1N2_9RHOB|nr:hypothetical protein [Roseovarius azorensis]SEM27484.1 hypothetical protein SAMN05443999_11814 [Roseovarius azorensis]
MLINILAWIFGPTKTTRRRSGGGGGGDELLGWLLLVWIVSVFVS